MRFSVMVAAGILFLYHAVDIWVNIHSSIHHYTVHLMLILLLSGLAWAEARARKEGAGRTGLATALLLVPVLGAIALYLYFNVVSLQISQPFLSTPDYVVGLALLAVVLFLTWVIWGWFLALLCISAAAYLWLGNLLPEPWKAPEAEPFIIMSYLAGLGTTRGLFNYIPLSADTIFLLIVYGGLLRTLGVIDMFAELGVMVGRFLRGGIAYSSVVASSLIGLVTGQAVSNIVLSGSMTIPAMMRRGFSGPKAGAIECLASNGSQLLPPIMGLGAFLMAAILGVPYIDIAAAAVIPAILYVAIITISIRALVNGTPEVIDETNAVDWELVKHVLPSFVLSLGAIVVLLYNHYSGGLAGFCGISILVVMSYLRSRAYRPKVSAFVDGIVDGSVNAAKLGLILAAIGVLTQTMTTTGLGFTLGRVMLDLSGSNLYIGLVLGMVLSLIIGMGLPTPAAYTVIAMIIVPPLIDLGVEPIAAHFFGFYFGIFSSLSPPVAVGVLTAVRISGAGFMPTARECIKLGCIGLLLPFLFVAFPEVLDPANLSLRGAVAALLMVISTYMIGCAFYGVLGGRLSVFERMALAVGPVVTVAYLFAPSVWLGTAVPAILVCIMLAQRWRTIGLRRYVTG